MNIKHFTKFSQDYFSSLLSSSTFNLENREEFGIINEPYDLEGKKYQIYPFKTLTGYLPDPKKKDEPVLYTFFVLRADKDTKERFLDEVKKKNSNQECDENIIGSYYSSFVSTNKQFDTLTYSLEKMLEEDFFPGKGYEFMFHLATITKDFDIVLVFLQLNSIDRLEAMYPGEERIYPE